MSAAAPDLFLEALQAKDPVAPIHRLRAVDPVHWVPAMDLWVLTRHDDVKWLLNDPEHATRDRSQWEHYVPREAGTWLRWFDDHNFARQDPIAHQRFRRRFIDALTPRAVRRMDAQIREVVERFAAPLRDRPGEVVDLMGDFTNPIPNTVISRVTGIPTGDDELRFRDLAQGLIRGFIPFATDEELAIAETALAEMASWVREMAAARREALGEDLISDLLRAQAQGDPIDDDEIVMLISLLIGAGSETTNLGGMMMIRSLMEHPDEMKRVREDRRLIPQAVGECMRFSTGGGAAGLLRWVAKDFEHRGRKLRKGQALLLSFGGANRDPEVFPDPDRLDLDRDVRESLVFGHGAHFCLGANLARQEMGAMLDAALDILTPGSCLRPDLQVSHRRGLFERPSNLPIELGL
jgi:cytochrome P450